MILRTMDRKPINTTTHTRKCEICDGVTREGKPYCPEHVDQNSYVKNILQTLEVQEKEQKDVLKKGARAIEKNSLTVQEMGMHLAIKGRRTMRRLAREMNLDLEIVRVYAGHMVKQGHVSAGKTTRGAETLALIDGSKTK